MARVSSGCPSSRATRSWVTITLCSILGMFRSSSRTNSSMLGTYCAVKYPRCAWMWHCELISELWYVKLCEWWLDCSVRPTNPVIFLQVFSGISAIPSPVVGASHLRSLPTPWWCLLVVQCWCSCCSTPPLRHMGPRRSISGFTKQYMKVGQSAKNCLFGVPHNNNSRWSSGDRDPLQPPNSQLERLSRGESYFIHHWRLQLKSSTSGLNETIVAV